MAQYKFRAPPRVRVNLGSDQWSFDHPKEDL